MPELKTLKVGEVQILPKTKTEAIIFDTPIEEISKESREIKEELNTINGEPIANIGQGLSKLVDTKKNLMTAIQGNGVQIDKATPFDQYAEKISQITAGEPEITYSVIIKYRNNNKGIHKDFIETYKPKDIITLDVNKYHSENIKSPSVFLGWSIPQGIQLSNGNDQSEIISFTMPHYNCQFICTYGDHP